QNDEAPPQLVEDAEPSNEAPPAPATDEPVPDETASEGEPTEAATAPDEPGDARRDGPENPSNNPHAPARLPRQDRGAAAPLEQSPEEPEADEQAKATVEPFNLNGVYPGRTTRKELRAQWGKPEGVEKIAGGAREWYHIEKLGRVRATISEDVVESL